MGKVKDDFGYMGLDYQIRLLAQVITDEIFAKNIMDIFHPNYFGDQYLRLVASEIKDAFDTSEVIPDLSSIEFRLRSRMDNEAEFGFLKTQLTLIKNANLNDSEYVQDMAMKFCKQKEFDKAIIEATKIMHFGEMDDYIKIEALFKRVLEMGDNKDDDQNVFDDIDNVLSDDFRQPIPTGILGLDGDMNGGLAKGELGVILAPFGVGKTTMMTKLANTAVNAGYNVLQIFFEDSYPVIKRKHYACWANGKFKLNELTENSEEVKEIVKQMEGTAGQLRLKRFPSHSTTIPIIKQYIRKKKAQGFKPDMVLLDYIDCVSPSQKVADTNVGEGMVMREFETMLAELNLVGWTAVQGNRSSINADVVDSSMIGGSIKRGQIGHFILSIAKNEEQQLEGSANLAILKSRFGPSGKRYEDVIFDNARVYIDASQHKVLTPAEAANAQEAKTKESIANALLIAQQMRQGL